MDLSSWIETAPWPVFAISAGLLCCGLLGMVWWDAMRLSFLDAVPLDVVERRHPHLPSLTVITGVVLCAGLLLFVASLAFRGHTLLGWDTARLNLVSLFSLLAGAGVLAELKRGLHGHAFGVASGSALAFAAALLVGTRADLPRAAVLGLLAVLLLCVAAARLLLFRGWSVRVLATTLLTLATWLVLILAG